MDNGLTVLHSVSSDSEAGKQRFYYVSDLHLEYQLENDGTPVSEKQEAIISKVTELVSSADDTTCPLLIAGDTGDSYETATLLFEILLSHWNGDIFAVLGNHELWDTDCDTSKSIDEIVARYKAFATKHPRLHFLENELIIMKSSSVWKILSETQLLEMNSTDFWKLYGLSSYMILGGIGFTGLNPDFNAQTGVYKGKVTIEEDSNRSARLSRLHERLRLCAGAFRSVILTHNPPEDWCEGRLCSNWVYVCGHTHRNDFSCPQNGPVILKDNQMGYVLQTWELKAFSANIYHEYDPLDYLPNGISCISGDEYINFLRSSGIGIQSFSRQGTIFVVKHDGAYMFLLEGKKLYILNGGMICVASHPLSYYDEHLTRYISQVRKAFIPYDNAKKHLAQEIRKLGGWGSDHGCIIDIDFRNHICCDPRDGTLNFYYATDIVNKVFFHDFMHLIRESPSLPCREMILKNIESGSSVSAILPPVNESALLSLAPEIVNDTSMYNPSRRMRSVQYLLEKEVIRFWQDEILNYDFDSEVKRTLTV